MPYHVDTNSPQCPAGKPHAVVKTATGKLVACHPTKAKAQAQMAALYAQEQQKSEEKPMSETEQNSRPPREDLVRALPRGFELRDTGADSPPTMVGHFAKFDEWTEIDSVFEGHFMERVAPGAFKKTFSENAGRILPLFQHGMDPQVGDKPLGAVEILEEDRQGAYYEVPLLDAPYVRDNVLPGLRAGLYGASFRFSVQREEFNRDAKPSDSNPKGLPERTLKEVAVREFGPVTFPAYAGATAGVRSLTDDYMARRLARDPRVLVEALRMDSEDLSTLAQMIALGTEYIDDQDEPGDQANIPRMESVLATLTELAQYEANEDEGTEPEDESESSGRSKADAATSTSAVDAPSTDAAHKAPRQERREPQTWPKVSQEEWEELEEQWIRRI